MVSSGNEEPAEEIPDELESGRSSRPPKLKEYRIRVPPIRVPSFRSRLLDQQALYHQPRSTRVLDVLRSRPSIEWFKNFRISSPLAIFRRTVNKREEISLSVPSPVGIRKRFHIHFIRKINWGSVFDMCKEWLMNPMNIALLLWLICVAVAATMLGLLLLGLLNGAFPSTSLRNYWIEIDNQVLNALFTLMSLYQHPNLFHHLVLLFRWRSEDIIELRKTYCKNGAYRPREWAHMMVVITLLHITCLAQYVMCGLYWGYSRETRPEFAENFFFAFGTLAPVAAAVYTVYSPLGREYEDGESQIEVAGADGKPNKLGLNLYDRRVVVSKPEWVGGLLDCHEDIPVCYLSFFCTCCVFGWNVERLGFGNMYVHIVTFLLLCLAPFWIFNTTALNIKNYMIGDIFGVAGIVLCVCGLLYGGFWRIQMRKRFKLPGNTFCCGSASLTDYFQWMFCWSCSLAQEVRTGNFYDVEDDSLYRKLMDGGDQFESLPVFTPSRGRGPSPLIRSDRCSTPLPLSYRAEFSKSLVIEEEVGTSFLVEEKFSKPALVDVMTAPVQQLLQLEDGAGDGTSIAPSTGLDDRVGDGDTISLPPSSSLIQTEERVGDDSITAPLINLEEGISDGDAIGPPPSSPSLPSSKIEKFVHIMQYSLFIVFVYALGAALLR